MARGPRAGSSATLGPRGFCPSWQPDPTAPASRIPPPAWTRLSRQHKAVPSQFRCQIRSVGRFTKCSKPVFKQLCFQPAFHKGVHDLESDWEVVWGPVSTQNSFISHHPLGKVVSMETRSKLV